MVLGVAVVVAAAPGPARAADVNWLVASYGASVTTPSGEYSGRVVGRVMDENSSTYWNSTAVASNAQLNADLGVARSVARFVLDQHSQPETTHATALGVYSSDCGGSWTLRQEYSGLTASVQTLTLAVGVTARCWRLQTTAGGGSGWGVSAWEIIGPEADPTPTPVVGVQDVRLTGWTQSVQDVMDVQFMMVLAFGAVLTVCATALALAQLTRRGS